MSRKLPELNVLRVITVLFWGIALALTAWTFYLGVLINAPRTREHAHQHSIKLWGKPLQGTRTALSGIKPAGTGAYRTATYQFHNKFGELQSINGDFKPNAAPQTIVVWQQATSAETYLPGTYVHDDDPSSAYGGSSTSKYPFYSGIATQVWFTILGIVLAIIVLAVSGFILWIIYEE